MKNAVEDFIKELKSDESVRGILLFGSYARGDQRPNSDVDIFVLVKEKAWRDIFERDGQTFEMVYASFDLAKDFYASHPNDAVQQWTDGKIVYDPDGLMKKLKEYVFAISKKGPEPLTDKQIRHLQFEKADKIHSIEYLRDFDPATANLYLQTLCQELVELFFKMNHKWTPAPKQRLPYMRKFNPEMAGLFDSLFNAQGFTQQLNESKKIIEVLFSRYPFK